MECKNEDLQSSMMESIAAPLGALSVPAGHNKLMLRLTKNGAYSRSTILDVPCDQGS